jgi:hypothetical protein
MFKPLVARLFLAFVDRRPRAGLAKGTDVKTRELRRKVLIKARIRVVASWGDVCILNISSRGMQLQAARPPERGTYVEIRRGPHVIIGCVAWTKQHRFGVKSQDVLFVDAIIAEPGDDEVQRRQPAYTPVDRRVRARAADGGSSRLIGRALEFACLGCVVAGGALALYGAAAEAFAKPLSAVSQALGD